MLVARNYSTKMANPQLNPKLECHSYLGRLSKEPRLAGKVAIITGASRGFGQAIAVRFVEEGAKVVLCSRSGCDKTVEIIKDIAGIICIDDLILNVCCDISNEDSVKSMVGQIETKFGSAAHILVNNAAAFVFHSVETASAGDWEQSCATNIVGNAMMTKHCLPLLKKGPLNSLQVRQSYFKDLFPPF